jgi:hypothetical protein
MKQTIFLAVAMLVAAAALSGCGLGQSRGEKAGEKMAEKALEAQTGGKVDIDANNGKVNIKTKDGESQISTGGDIKVPDSFPKELIAAEDAKVIVATNSENGDTIAFTTDTDQSTIFEKYKTELPGAGWKQEMVIDLGNGKMASFSKGELKATINIGENSSKDKPGQTMVNLVLIKEKSPDSNNQ